LCVDAGIRRAAKGLPLPPAADNVFFDNTDRLVFAAPRPTASFYKIKGEQANTFSSIQRSREGDVSGMIFSGSEIKAAV